MDKKLKLIMLIDDDEHTNLFNEIIITKKNICDEIQIFQNGKSALDFLTNKNDNGYYPQPEIIFLDINMPVMNGWEFIEHYNKLTKIQQAKVLIAMLSSSVNKDDELKAFKTGVVKEFINKPLLEKKINTIIDKYLTN